MKILLLNYEYTLTGATLLLLRLAEHLRQSGHQVTASAAVPEPGPIRAMYQQRGFTVLDLPFSGVFDVAIFNSVQTAPQLLMACAGLTKTIWWIHEDSVGLEYLLRNPAQREAFARASLVVFPIEHLRDTIYRSFIYAYEQSRFVVIPGGIPPIAAPGSRASASAEFRIVSVGSIYLVEGAGQEVGGAHPRLEGAERVFDGLSSHAHGLGHAIEPVLHPVEHVLIHPALDAPQLGRRAPGPERTGEACGATIRMRGVFPSRSPRYRSRRCGLIPKNEGIGSDRKSESKTEDHVSNFYFVGFEGRRPFLVQCGASSWRNEAIMSWVIPVPNSLLASR